MCDPRYRLYLVGSFDRARETRRSTGPLYDISRLGSRQINKNHDEISILRLARYCPMKTKNHCMIPPPSLLATRSKCCMRMASRFNICGHLFCNHIALHCIKKKYTHHFVNVICGRQSRVSHAHGIRMPP